MILSMRPISRGCLLQVYIFMNLIHWVATMGGADTREINFLSADPNMHWVPGALATFPSGTRTSLSTTRSVRNVPWQIHFSG